MRAIVLVDHGSRLEAANAQLEEVASLVARTAGDGTSVRAAHMELGSPTLGEAVERLVAEGATEIVIVPYFLAPGRHASVDVPRLAHEAAARHPRLSLRVTAPLGVHELLAQLVLARVRE